MNKYIYIILHLIVASGVAAQEETLLPLAQLTDEFPFVDSVANEVQQPYYLTPFFTKLRDVGSDSTQQVRVVHIGDSHIQADFWTGELRRLFQSEFGNAGRGLIFPFGLAQSHNPTDVVTKSNIEWSKRTNAKAEGPEIGIAGASIATTNPKFHIELLLKDEAAKFNRFTLFNNKGAEAFDFTLGKGDVKMMDQGPVGVSKKYHRVRKGETLSHIAKRYGCSVSQLRRWNGIRGSRIDINQKLKVSPPIYSNKPSDSFEFYTWLGNSEYPDTAFYATLVLDKLANQLVIKGEKLQETQKETVFHGVLLENTNQTGVLYNAIGVNGVTYEHYNQAELFFEQLPALKADLIIVSLGTNEALSSRFDEEEFRTQTEQFFLTLRQVQPNVPVLVTTNPDCLRKGKYIAEGVAQAKKVILEQSHRHGFAVWDLHTIMGGNGSVNQWSKKGLTARDKIHFTKEGYQLQGQLLYHAIKNAYNAGY